jgi:hypothetical protein
MRPLLAISLLLALGSTTISVNAQLNILPPSSSAQPPDQSVTKEMETLKRNDLLSEKYISAYKNCTDRNTAIFAKSDEPAETIATAVLAACSSFEQDFFKFMLSSIRVEQAEAVITKLRQRARENIILGVLQSRPHN